MRTEAPLRRRINCSCTAGLTAIRGIIRFSINTACWTETVTYGSESGFCIVYRFYIRPGASLEHVSVRVEQGDKYRICCNGHPLHWSAVDPALERGLYEAQLIGLAPGRNELRLICPEFDAELEIEPVYVTGRFSVTASGGRWELGAEKPLSYGSLKEQGYPFYGGAVLYQYTVTSDGGRGRIVLPENLNAAAVSIAVK